MHSFHCFEVILKGCCAKTTAEIKNKSNMFCVHAIKEVTVKNPERPHLEKWPLKKICMYVQYGNKQSMDCDTQMTAACLFTYTFCRQSIVTCKVGHTDLVFGVRSGFISRSAHIRLQVSVCSSYDLFHPG